MTVMTSGIATTGDTPLLERERELAVFDELLGDWTPDELRTFAELLTRHNDAVAERYLRA